MFKIIKNFEISSILSAVPKNINNNFKFFKKKNFNESRRVIKVLGVKSSFKSKPNTSTVDLFLFAAKKILIKNYIDKSNIGILICVTQTPDYLMPSCSNIVHQKLKLDERCPAYDINLGCSGYVYSLWNIMSVMQSNNIKKGLLLVGDTISKTISKNDMSNNLLFGDAVSATIISYKKKSINYFKLGSISTYLPKNNKHSRSWKWTVSGDRAVDVMLQLNPFLGIRRQEKFKECCKC